MTRFTFVLMTVMLATTGTALQAQSIGYTITPKLGFFAPVTDLSEAEGVTSKIKSGLALGLALELDFRRSPISVRANADIAINSDVESDGTASGLKADQLNLVGDLLVRPFSRNYIVQPFVMGGAGIKRYTFSDDDFDISTSEQSFTWHVGGGIILDFGGAKLSLELSDYISSYESAPTVSKGQHDVFGMLGLRIPLN